MKQPVESLAGTLWKTPLLRRILVIILLAGVLAPSYNLLFVHPRFKEVLIKSVETEAIHTGRHLLSMMSRGNGYTTRFTSDLIDESTRQRLNRATTDLGLWKTRLFSADGEILFSTVSGEIGSWNRKDYFRDQVARGGVFSRIESKQGTTMEGETLPLDVVEVYLPVMHDGQFLGAIEVYYDVTGVNALLQSLLREAIWVFIGLTTAVTLISVMLLFRGAKDTRELTQTRNALAMREKMFRDIFESAQDGILVANADKRIETVNPAFTRITGYRSDEVTGQSPSMLKSGRHDSRFYQEMWESIRTRQYWRGEIWNRRKEGGIYPEWLSISAIRDNLNNIERYVGIFNDISQQKASEHQYQEMAYHDPLTRLPNRLLFQDRLTQAMHESERDGEPAVLMFIDLDGFKDVNDHAGHEAGDAVLVEVASRLTDNVRSIDTVARLGGDEFTVVLTKMAGWDSLQRLADALLQVINEPIRVADHVFQIGASIGIACYPANAQDADALVAQADKAMYEAKQAGKNRIVMCCRPADFGVMADAEREDTRI